MTNVSRAQPATRSAIAITNMSSERDSQRKAEDLKQRAARASESFYKSAYEKAAECWTVLARTDSLLHDEKDNETPSKPGL